MKGKNCLIFGGSGQIGRNLIRKLAKNNYKMTIVTRNIHQKSYLIKTQANAGSLRTCTCRAAGLSLLNVKRPCAIVLTTFSGQAKAMATFDYRFFRYHTQPGMLLLVLIINKN